VRGPKVGKQTDGWDVSSGCRREAIVSTVTNERFKNGRTTMNLRVSMRQLACAATIGLFAISAQAASTAEKAAKDDYKATVKHADDNYKVAKDACKAKSGNDKDVCMKEAKATYTKAKADAKATRKTRDAHADASEDKMKASYAVAKEKCDAMSGDPKDRCIKEAKARYKQ